MHWRAIIRLFGLLLMLYSLGFPPSLVLAVAILPLLGVFGMLAGRLEIFTLLILFLPAFWRH